MAGLFDLMDSMIAESLGVDVETYINVIEHKCTEEESTFIIMTILDEDSENYEKAKQLFTKYVEEDKVP